MNAFAAHTRENLEKELAEKIEELEEGKRREARGKGGKH